MNALTYKLPLYVTALFFSMLFYSCGSETETPTNVGDPSDLQVEVNVASDNSGTVTVVAQATNDGWCV